MQINAKQMAMFDAIALDEFTHRLAEFVRAQCGAPDAFNPSLVPADNAELRLQVSTRLRRARDFGLKGEDALAAFVSLTFSYSTDFDHIPAVREILVNDTESPDQQMFKVFGLLVDAERRRHLGQDQRVSSRAQVAR